MMVWENFDSAAPANPDGADNTLFMPDTDADPSAERDDSEGETPYDETKTDVLAATSPMLRWTRTALTMTATTSPTSIEGADKAKFDFSWMAC